MLKINQHIIKLCVLYSLWQNKHLVKIFQIFYIMQLILLQPYLQDLLCIIIFLV